MIITMSPIAWFPGQPETTLTIAGDVITVDGIDYDLSAVPEGGEAMPEGDHPFIGAIRREAGVIHCAIPCRYDADTAAPNQPVDPEHLVVTASDGAVALPIIRKEGQA